MSKRTQRKRRYQQTSWLTLADFDNPAVEDLMLMASDPLTPRQVLDFLLKAPDTSVRAALAANPNLPRPYFLVLLADRALDVVEAVLANPCVPYDLLQATADTHPHAAARELATSLLQEFSLIGPVA